MGRYQEELQKHINGLEKLLFPLNTQDANNFVMRHEGKLICFRDHSYKDRICLRYETIQEFREFKKAISFITD